MLARKALAGTAGAPKEYVEDVFSTYLYTGTGASQAITNNIDLSGKGGLVWIKGRNFASNHWLADTERGNTKYIRSNTTGANLTYTDLITSFNNNGFTLGTDSSGDVNTSPNTHASWTFRKAKKFFDVVTYTGNGSAPRNISHNLDSSPGFIAIKRTDSTGDWWCWHRSIANKNIYLNYTDAADSGANPMISAVSSTNFTLATNQNATMNINGATYVAYLFAHDAGGFGDAGSDSIIKCGTFTTDGSGNATVDLGYEPQYVIVKRTDAAEGWFQRDVMRGMSYSQNNYLYCNTSEAESNGTGSYFVPTATGFTTPTAGALSASATYIYIAIRRGPMKTPTDATKVFAVTSFTGVDAAQTSNFPVDFVMNSENLTGTVGWFWVDRLRGATKKLESNASNAEGSVTSGVWDSNTTVKISGSGNSYKRSYPMFRRAPGFFDVVCYTGTGSNTTISHNLSVAPELIICKSRSSNPGANWVVWHKILNSSTGYLYLNSSMAADTFSGVWNGAPTSTYFTLGTNYQNNNSGTTFVAYLFASVSGVSKVGSYTGNGSSVTVTTDFQPRFILVKRTDSTGDWIVSDSARGLVAGNDPYLLLNSSAAEDTDEDWVDITSTSFTVNQTTAANANVNTGTYIYLAIA